MMNCVILDDEPLALQVLEHYIGQTPLLHLAASFRNAIEAYEYLRKHPVDVLFLDIEMPLVNGVHFLKSLSEVPKTIFTTAYKHYAFDGFELDVVDYLLKPFSYQRFIRAVDKLKSPPAEATYDPVFIRVNKSRIPVNQYDVLYIESAKDYIHIISLHEQHQVYHTLKSFSAKLDQALFLQIHRSFLINKQHVKSVQPTQITLTNDFIIPIGKSYQKHVRKAIFHKTV